MGADRAVDKPVRMAVFAVTMTVVVRVGVVLVVAVVVVRSLVTVGVVTPARSVERLQMVHRFDVAR